MELIDKDAIIAKIEKLEELYCYDDKTNAGLVAKAVFNSINNVINTLEVKELASIAYVVTRCEEHSDYVEEVFFDEDRAQEYCDQFKGNENEYARHITKVKVTL